MPAPSAPTVTPAELRQALQILVDKCAGEAGQRGAVIKALAALGHHSAPKVYAGRMEGGTLRMYEWSYAGGIILATGPNFAPKVISPSEIKQSQHGVYVLAEPDRSKAGSRAETATSKAKTRMDARSKKAASMSARPRPARKTPAAKKAAETVTRQVSKTTSRQRKSLGTAIARASASRPPPTITLKSKSSLEVAELNNALKALLG